MNKDEKTTAVAELMDTFGRARLAIVTESAGLSVNQITELRKQLRGANAEYMVVKNTLAVRAAGGTILSGVTTYLKGPTGLVIFIFCSRFSARIKSRRILAGSTGSS